MPIQSYRLILIGLTVIQSPPKPGFPALDADDKKFNRRPVVPIEID